MTIQDELQFKVNYPKLYELVQETAQEDGVDLSQCKFKGFTLQDEEYASVDYDSYTVDAQGSEDDSYGEWTVESAGPP